MSFVPSLLLAVCFLAYEVSSRSGSYYLAMDAGTESLRVGIFDEKGKVVASEATPYQTSYPSPGFFEQDPADWWDNFSISCKKALAKAKEQNEDFKVENIKALCCDTTACSVLILDENMSPIRPCLLWADSRSHGQTEEILAKASGDPALAVNCNGKGPLSAEWMLPKSLWLKQNEGDIWEKSTFVCEKQDWINWKLTDRYCASGCNTAARWHWDAEAACAAEKGSLAGRPVSLLKAIGLEDILEKWPQECVGMGEYVGTLTADAARHLGLQEGLRVVQGGPDAYVGMIGLGVCEPGSLALITGSSHLHLAISDLPTTADGVWGAYKGAPMNGLCFAEGGQSSTGSMITWLKRLLGQGTGQEDASVDKLGFRLLDEECESSPPGARGLLCLETFQGSRTPVTDAKARGAFVGLTLAHTRGDIWRAALEGICLGTRAAIEAMEKAGLGGQSEIAITGGATRSPVFLQMHADITGKTVVVGETDNAVLLGGAILAKAGSDRGDGDGGDDGLVSRVKGAIADMVREAKRVHPDEEKAARYRDIYAAYRALSGAVSDTNHALTNDFAPAAQAQTEAEARPGAAASPLTVHQPIMKMAGGGSRRVYVVPSILAADFGNLASEAKLCADSGCSYLHVDMCDGGDMAQGELSIGPQAVAAIHRANPSLKLDVHLVCSRPGQFIAPLSEAGVERLTVQYECLKRATEDDGGSEVALYGLVKAFAMAVLESGMKFGVCIAPETPIEEVVQVLGDLLEGTAPLVEFLDILAVKPGKGGQPFDRTALKKLQYVRQAVPSLPFLGIDGGVSHTGTAQEALEAGANYLIAGSAVFSRNRVAGENDSLVTSNIGALVDVCLKTSL